MVDGPLTPWMRCRGMWMMAMASGRWRTSRLHRSFIHPSACGEVASGRWWTCRLHLGCTCGGFHLVVLWLDGTRWSTSSSASRLRFVAGPLPVRLLGSMRGHPHTREDKPDGMRLWTNWGAHAMARQHHLPGSPTRHGKWQSQQLGEHTSIKLSTSRTCFVARRHRVWVLVDVFPICIPPGG